LECVIWIRDEEHLVLKRGWIHQDPRHRSRNCHGGAHREIHPAGGDNKCHADGKQHHGRAVSKDIDQATAQIAVPAFDGEKSGDKDEIK